MNNVLTIESWLRDWPNEAAATIDLRRNGANSGRETCKMGVFRPPTRRFFYFRSEPAKQKTEEDKLDAQKIVYFRVGD